MGKSSKSAQGLSLNTIVIAAIVLAVLIVIIGAFTGFLSSKFIPGFAGAVEKKCENVKDECDSLTEQEVFGNFGKDFPQGKKCCKNVAVSCEGANLYCLPFCDVGYEAVDKNADGLPYSCQDPAESCCLRNF